MAHAKPTAGLIIGGKYRLVDRIGGGGMGEVFRAENVLAGRHVALKLLRPELADDGDVTLRFFQEAQAVNRIRHPGIVDVIDAGFGETGPYIAMECLEGASTGAVLARVRRFSVEAAAGVGVAVLAALGAAHRVGIIHRDLKPENVFLHRPAGDASPVAIKLLDFGIAKVLASGGPTPRTHTGVVFGTPDYLSPEQAAGQDEIDGRSDLFAVGVLLFELVTGVRPFVAPGALATAYKVVHAEAPRLLAVGGPSHEALQRIVDRAMQKDPSKRYRDAAAFGVELDAAVPDERARSDALSRLLASAQLPVAPPAASTAAAEPSPSRPSSRPGPPSLEPTMRSITPEMAIAVARALKRAPAGGASYLRAGAEGRGSDGPVRAGEMSARPARAGIPSPRPAAATPGGARPAAATPGGARPAAAMPGGARSPGAPQTPVPSSPTISSDRRSLAREAEARSSTPAPSPRLPGPTPGWFSAQATPRIALSSSPPRRALDGPPRVRGTVLRAMDAAIGACFGDVARQKILAKLPAALAQDYRQQAITGLVLYDVSVLDSYAMAANEVVFHGDLVQWREIGRKSAEGELRSLLRPLERGSADLSTLVRRGMGVWSRLLEFGSWSSAETGSGAVALRIADITPAPVALRIWLVGLIEQSIRLVGYPQVAVEVLLGEAGRVADLQLEIAERT